MTIIVAVFYFFTLCLHSDHHGKVQEGVKEEATQAGSQRVSVLVQVKADFLAQELKEKVKSEVGSCSFCKGAFPWRPGLTKNGQHIMHLFVKCPPCVGRCSTCGDKAGNKTQPLTLST